MDMEHRHSSSGITLLELLLVITIISILAGMSVGLISYVKNRVLCVSCVNNLRQVGAIAGMYATENSNRYPAEGNKGQDNPALSPAWFFRLPEILEQKDVDCPRTIFQCPAYCRTPSASFTNASPKSYKMNSALDADGRPIHYRLKSVPDESEIVFFADSLAGDTGIGQWGHLPTTGIDDQRHGKRVNILHLDGSSISTKNKGSHTWQEELRWKSCSW
jgi:prepilin-type processing-associated H-X9-DG protein